MKLFTTVIGFIFLMLAMMSFVWWFPDGYTVPPEQYSWRWWIARLFSVTTTVGFAWMIYLNRKQK